MKTFQLKTFSLGLKPLKLKQIALNQPSSATKCHSAQLPVHLTTFSTKPR
jgi:hypothetical protein